MNAAVKVQADDWLVLGEVCYCRRERSHYAVGLQLDQALLRLQELAALSRVFQPEEDLVLR